MLDIIAKKILFYDEANILYLRVLLNKLMGIINSLLLFYGTPLLEVGNHQGKYNTKEKRGEERKITRENSCTYYRNEVFISISAISLNVWLVVWLHTFVSIGLCLHDTRGRCPARRTADCHCPHCLHTVPVLLTAASAFHSAQMALNTTTTHYSRIPDTRLQDYLICVTG